MTYKLPRYRYLYDNDTKMWLIHSEEFNMSSYDKTPSAAFERFCELWEDVCNHADGYAKEDLKKFEAL